MICEFEFEHCDIWFLRFGISQDYRFLATGNQVGQIFLWDLQEIPYFIDSYIDKKKSKSPGMKMEKSVVKKKGGGGSNSKKSKTNNNGGDSTSGGNSNSNGGDSSNNNINNNNNNGNNSNSNSNNINSDGKNTYDTTSKGTNNNGGNIVKKVCKPAVLGVDICDSTIRQVAFSKDRQWMITVCDDATVWGWKLNREISGQQTGSSRYDPMVIDD